MTKFTDKAMTGFPMAFYYAAMKAMDDRTAAVETTLERFLTMETESVLLPRPIASFSSMTNR